MKYYLRIISLVLLGVNISRGQDTTGTAIPSSFHVLSITIGVNQVKEENLLPRVHTGFITSLSYGHRRIGERYQDFRFTLGFSRILIDLKAWTEKFYNEVCGGEMKPVLDTLRRLRKKGMWTEIVVLVISRP